MKWFKDDSKAAETAAAQTVLSGGIASIADARKADLCGESKSSPGELEKLRARVETLEQMRAGDLRIIDKIGDELYRERRAKDAEIADLKTTLNLVLGVLNYEVDVVPAQAAKKVLVPYGSVKTGVEKSHGEQYEQRVYGNDVTEPHDTRRCSCCTEPA